MLDHHIPDIGQKELLIEVIANVKKANATKEQLSTEFSTELCPQIPLFLWPNSLRNPKKIRPGLE